MTDVPSAGVVTDVSPDGVMTDVPPEMDSVVRRWYPVGADLVAAERRAAPRGVFVTGTPGSGVSAVGTELDALAGDVAGVTLHHATDAASAAVVVFVIDASAPLGRRALADLAPVLESTAVAILVNKTDVHRDWREVHRSVSQAVEEYVPRSVDVSFWPTSAKLAERSRIAVDGEVRAALIEESGLEDVLRYLVYALEQPPALLRERKYNAAVHVAAAGARREIVAKARAVTSGANTVDLRAERSRLTDIRDRARTDRAAVLRSRMQLARSQVAHDVGEAARVFATKARDAIDSANSAELSHLQKHLGEQLRHTVIGVEDRLDDRLRAIDADLGLAAELPPRPESTVSPADPSPRSRGVEDKMMIVVGASAGVGLGRIAVSPVSMVPALDITVIPVSLVLGALCAWWLVRSRKLVADRTHLRTWVGEAAVAARSSSEQSSLARILTAEQLYTAAAHETSLSASTAAESELERVEAELRAAAEHRAGVLAACDRDLTALDRGLEKFDLPIRKEPSAESTRLNR